MKYSYQGDEKKTAKAYGKEINVSWKNSNEVCYAVKGMKTDKALNYLERVQNKEDFIPFRRYNKQIPHRSKGTPGRYPVKASKFVSNIIKDAVANAENKGLNTENLKIIHSTAYKSVELDRIKPKRQ